MLLPCSYVIAAIDAVKADLIDWILPMWRVDGLVLAYSHIELYPVTITNLDINKSIRTLERRVLRGRISKKRKEKGSKPDTIYQG
jgi:hypothetical protein